MQITDWICKRYKCRCKKFVKSAHKYLAKVIEDSIRKIVIYALREDNNFRGHRADEVANAFSAMSLNAGVDLEEGWDLS